MIVFNQITELQEYLKSYRDAGQTIGFVPTMGALHDGHLSLVSRALEDCHVVVVSIFVNPTQFDNKKDLETYPRTLEADLGRLKSITSDAIVLFAPDSESIYGTNVVAQQFNFNGLEHEMEGAHRTGHFDGVGTIVKHLFEIVLPHYAFFGEKDYQQLQIIKQLVKNHDMPVKIVGCPIFREADGLAFSSRNVRLSSEHRKVAPFIFETLQTAKIKFGTKSAQSITEWVQKEFKNQSLLELEYFTIADAETLKPVKRKSKKKAYRAFIAVYAGDVRLIDNIALN